ncbi:MAG: MoxR family ATPase, partial [Oscillospiraceae bacterium]|nr:MoxR family ATPase [Oscillospiraceae bacterium]
LSQLQPVCAAQDITNLQSLLPQVYSSPELRQYIAEIAARTRQHPMLSLGVSPRGAIALLKASQAYALLSGRDYVLPDDVRQLIRPVLSHRIQLTPEARMKAVSPESLLDEMTAAVAVPVKRRI